MKKIIEIDVNSEAEIEPILSNLKRFDAHLAQSSFNKSLLILLCSLLLIVLGFEIYKFQVPHLGTQEKVFLGLNKEINFIAKVDSGAETSSIHAFDIKLVKTNGIDTVQYTTEDDSGKRWVMESPLSRISLVKSASGIANRFFIKQTVWIGGQSYLAEVNLANRSNLSKKMLIGNNIIRLGYLVNAKKSFLISQN